MAKEVASRACYRDHTVCLPIGEDEYRPVVDDPRKFRDWVDQCHKEMPELFPEGFSKGYGLKDHRVSTKTGLAIRRIELRDGTAYSVCPSFVMPYMTGRTDDVESALFLRKFGVPYWALAHVFDRDPMYWYRLETSLGRNSIVGTTVRTGDLPEDILADEHHQTRDGERNYVATTVGGGCVLGAAVCESAGTDDLKDGYGVFLEEAHDVDPEYLPKTVNTDGWHGTQAAWRLLVPTIVILRCFLHAWLKIRQRGKHLGEVFHEVSQKVWDAYRAPDRRTFSQRIRSLQNWAKKNLGGVVLEKTLDLCAKRDQWSIAYDHPTGHRTSNMLDRLMRWMNRYFDDGLHLHGSLEASDLHGRSWALLHNFTPWHPVTTKNNHGWQCPAQRLNQKRYHHNWLHNLLVSASLGGRRKQAPQNP